MWDRMFGTYAPERADEPVVFGIRAPLARFDSVWGNLHYYKDIWIRIRSVSSFRAKCRLLFASPAESTSLEHFDSVVFRKYLPPVNIATIHYVAFQFAFTLVVASYFLMTFRQISFMESAWLASMVFSSALNQGLLLSASRWARHAEWLRITCLILSIGGAFLWPGLSASSVVIIAVTLSAAISVVWLGSIQLSKQTISY